MNATKLLERITVDPRICFGKPCIKGHRTWVSLALDRLAAGASVEEILSDYLGIERDDVLACIVYAAEVSRDHFIDVPLEAGR